jgi:hypothetical protein
LASLPRRLHSALITVITGVLHTQRDQVAVGFPGNQGQWRRGRPPSVGALPPAWLLGTPDGGFSLDLPSCWGPGGAAECRGRALVEAGFLPEAHGILTQPGAERQKLPFRRLPSAIFREQVLQRSLTFRDLAARRGAPSLRTLAQLFRHICDSSSLSPHGVISRGALPPDALSSSRRARLCHRRARTHARTRT